jgi:hypothetical protein
MPTPAHIAHMETSAIKRGWLRPLLTPWVRRAALVGFAASFFLPGTGFGVDLCPLHAATGLPCPGCGATRAVTLFSQGDFVTALGANPFVLVLWPGMVVLGLLAFAPSAWLIRMENRLDVFEPALSRAWRILLAAFFGFGMLRLLTFLVLGERFP